MHRFATPPSCPPGRRKTRRSPERALTCRRGRTRAPAWLRFRPREFTLADRGLSLDAVRRSPARGFTLIEVLIALAILAIGLLALAALQATALALGDDARFRTHAALLADDLAERMRLHPGDADRFVSVAPPAAACDATAAPTPENLLACWHDAVSRRLPAPPGELPAAEIERIDDPSGAQYLLTLRWAGVRAIANAGSTSDVSDPPGIETMQWVFRP